MGYSRSTYQCDICQLLVLNKERMCSIGHTKQVKEELKPPRDSLLLGRLLQLAMVEVLERFRSSD